MQLNCIKRVLLNIMKIMKKLSLAVLVLVLSLVSCKKDDETKDSEQPTIDLVKASNGNVTTTLSAEGEVELSLDSTVTATINVSDNEALSQIKVEIHSAFDSHDHARSAKSELDAFSLNKVIPLDGKALGVTLSLWDKSNANSYKTGDYHMEVILLDKEGNQSVKIYTIELGRDL